MLQLFEYLASLDLTGLLRDYVSFGGINITNTCFFLFIQFVHFCPVFRLHQILRMQIFGFRLRGIEAFLSPSQCCN